MLTETQLLELRYPIGKWEKPAKLNLSKAKKQISIIKKFPNVLKKDVAGLSEKQLETTYRPDGWTARQVIHHLADSHMNAFIRFKLALTEDHPSIKPYLESKWAETEDAKTADVKLSVQLINSLHKRWVILLKSMTPEQMNRTYHHPENGRDYKLYEVLSLYAWHCDHHLGHLRIVASK